ncbi:MAG: type II toxin-antitoxin system Phd/YefM family antitoxin [Alphaproteobacteria bacterium]|nr:type II toxin-antitoxin system Phd/YefM family antitoxin [Alphaproteobacteria bacterium]
MQYLSSTDARNSFSKAVELAQKEPVIIQKQGKDVAVVVSSEHYARMRKAMQHDFLELRKRMTAEAAAKGLDQEKLEALLADETDDV